MSLIEKVDLIQFFTLLLKFVGDHECADIPRDAIASAARDQFRTSLIGYVIILVNHLPDPVNLSSDVTIVSARVGANSYKRRTVSGEWPNCRNNDLGLLCEICELINVAGVSNENWNLLAVLVDLNHLFLNLLELTFGSSSDSPIDLSLVLLSHVLGSKLSCVPGSSKYHKIKLSGVHIFDFVNSKFLLDCFLKLQLFTCNLSCIWFSFERISNHIPSDSCWQK